MNPETARPDVSDDAPDTPDTSTLQELRAQRVAKLQMALNANGAQLDVDGRMGAKTRDALKAYQSAHGLKPTGRADAATVKALGG